MLQTYQTIIVGLIGFTGVIITMIANAKIQRNQIDRKIEHEKNSLRVALKSELVINKQIYELRIEQLINVSQGRNSLIPNKIFDGVYQKLLSQIGLLTEEEVKKVIQAQLLMAELPYKLRILVGTGNVQGVDNEFIRLNEEQAAYAAKMHKEFLVVIIQAIESIDEHLAN